MIGIAGSEFHHQGAIVVIRFLATHNEPVTNTPIVVVASLLARQPSSLTSELLFNLAGQLKVAGAYV